MILMSDGRDGAQKQQMDLVMARAEAAACVSSSPPPTLTDLGTVRRVPIHTIGWGRSHDPSSLWLLSNHTSGTYTFIKEFYDLRDTLAGILGSILSIACTNVKLHLSVPERRWFRIRKVAGTPGAVVSSTGKDVDISLGELRWGERRDILVEVEMVFGDAFSVGGEERREGRRSEGTATDAFFDQVGLSEDALDGFLPETFYEDEYAGLEDEVPVFEVCHSPSSFESVLMKKWIGERRVPRSSERDTSQSTHSLTLSPHYLSRTSHVRSRETRRSASLSS
jgi:hypothetical protein